MGCQAQRSVKLCITTAVSQSKLALGYGEWQSTVDTVTRLLKEAPNLQGIYKEEEIHVIP